MSPPSGQNAVVVATRSRPRHLRRCLAALVEQVGAPPFDVLVVDDAGHPPAEPIVGAFSDRLRVQLTRLPSQRGAAAARNAAFARMSADVAYIGLLDDDAEADPTWVARGVALLAAHDGLAGVVGRIEARHPERFLAMARQRIYDERDARYRSRAVQDELRRSRPGGGPDGLLLADYLSAGNCWLRAGADLHFDAAVRWGHDQALARRLLAAGGVIAYEPQLRIRHDHESRLGPCATRAFSHAYHSERGSKRARGGPALRLSEALRPAARQLLGRPDPSLPIGNTREPLPGRALLAALTGLYGLGRWVGRRE